MSNANTFSYHDGELRCEHVSVRSLCESHGTPLYIYSHRAFVDGFTSLNAAFSDVDHVICYSLKANANLAVIAALAQLGSGADIVSGGELFRALRAGILPSRIVYAGVGKTDPEIAAAQQAGRRVFFAQDQMRVRFTALQSDTYSHLAERAACQRIRPRQRLRTQQDVNTKRATLPDGPVEQQRGVLSDLVVLHKEFLEFVESR